MKEYFSSIILSLTILIFFTLSLASALHESLTYDEIVHLQEGRNALLYHTFDVDTFNPPLTREIAVVPYLFAKDFYTNPFFIQRNPLPGRIMMIIVGVGLLISLYFFAKGVFGESEALFASFLYAFEPSLLAHSHYVTMDIGVTLFFFLSVTILIALLKKYSKGKLLLLALATGLGMSAKLTFIPFFILTGIILILLKKKKDFLQIKNILRGLGFSTIIILTIWTTYFFSMHVVIKERKDATRASEKLLTYAQNHHNALLKNAIIIGKTQPIPLGDYLATLKNNVLRGSETTKCFFLGAYYPRCSWYFLPMNLFLKIPLSLWIMMFTGLCFLFSNKKTKSIAMLLSISMLSILVCLALIRIQPLVRYTLPLYPFLIILAAASWRFWQRNLISKLMLTGIVVLYIMGSLQAFPHFLSYVQELGGDRQHSYQLLMDSNLDWGQSLPDVTDYVQAQHIGTLHLSYFGRENGNKYNLTSDRNYGSYKENEICEFHTIKKQGTKELTLISISNWYICGYYKQTAFKNPKGIISDSFLVF